MSGWNSLDSVGTLHLLLQISGLMVAAIVIACGMTTYHFWSRWPDLVAIADRVAPPIFAALAHRHGRDGAQHAH